MAEKGYALSLDGDAFNELKNDINSLLKHTIYTMGQYDSDESQIGVAIKIKLVKEQGANDNRSLTIPKIEHKVKSRIVVQNERCGYVGGPKYELIWDKDSQDYYMREIEDGSLRLFDNDEEDLEGDDI